MQRAVRRPLGALVLSMLLVLSGCGGVGQPDPYDSSGIDGLEIPLDAPQQDDFVEVVDNPWLPLLPGAAWTYHRELDGEVAGTVENVVVGQTSEVADVATTVVRRVMTDLEGAVVSEATAWFGQDRGGNVWLFGEERFVPDDADASGSWRAGEDGARAGLAMPAVPRVGDGFQREDASGVAEDRVLLVDVAASRATAYDAWDDLLEAEVTTPLDPTWIARELYADGVGLVARDSDAQGESLRLVDFRPGER